LRSRALGKAFSANSVPPVSVIKALGSRCRENPLTVTMKLVTTVVTGMAITVITRIVTTAVTRVVTTAVTRVVTTAVTHVSMASAAVMRMCSHVCDSRQHADFRWNAPDCGYPCLHYAIRGKVKRIFICVYRQENVPESLPKVCARKIGTMINECAECIVEWHMLGNECAGIVADVRVWLCVTVCVCV
jgi:hypothetical protein